MSFRSLWQQIFAAAETGQPRRGPYQSKNGLVHEELQDGYRLIARQLSGPDIILKHLAWRDGIWLDRFTPATEHELADAHLYTVEIEGVRYRLVRSVMSVPSGFRYVSQNRREDTHALTHVDQVA